MDRSVWEGWTARARALKTEVHALGLAATDPRVPWYARAFAAVILGYALSPVDLIPDFIPILGYLDDLVLIPLGIALLLQMIPPVVMVEARERARRAASSRQPTNWTVAAAIVVLWLAALVLAGWVAARTVGPWR
jgi:uncharacterized membrane protein YkvA (DUF1232 family)